MRVGWMALVGIVGCSTRIPIEEQAVFQPRRTLDAHTFDFANAAFEEVFVDSSGVDLYAWHITREPAERTVLYFGGQGFHLVLAREFVAAMLAEVPVDLFVADYRGYGRSGGEPSVAALKADALRLYDVLTEERGVPAEEVVVHGHSMGSFMATHVAAEREVGALVLESGVTDVEGWTRAMVPGLMRVFLKFDIAAPLREESNVERVKQIAVPSRFVVGSEDPITPPELTEELLAASGAEDKAMVVIEGGEHNGLDAYPRFVRAYREFIGSL